MDRHEYMTTGEFAAAKGVSKDHCFIMMTLDCFARRKYPKMATDFILFISWKPLIPYGCCGILGYL